MCPIFLSCSRQHVSVLVHVCIVLYIKGFALLGSTSLDTPFGNIVQYLDVTKFFMMLLEKFYIGLWSSKTKLKLFPPLRHILLIAVMKSMSFIFSREECHDYRNYPLCYKMCDTHFKKTVSRAMCAEKQILFVDIHPLSMRHNPVSICYLPYPFVKEFRYPNESIIIPNVATDIIPFIYLLYRFASIEEYVMNIVRSS